MTVKLPYGENKMRVQSGWLCEFGKDVMLPAERLPIARRDLEEGFRRTLEPLNYRFPKPSESVFDSGSGEQADLLLGATVNRLEANLCFPFSGSSTLAFGNTNIAKGSIYLKITWEVFSVAERRVVLKTTTEGTFRASEAVSGAESTIALNAFIANLSNLAADEHFQELLLRRPEPVPD